MRLKQAVGSSSSAVSPKGLTRKLAEHPAPPASSTCMGCAAGLCSQPIAHPFHLVVRLLNALILALDDSAHGRGQGFIQRLLVFLDGVIFAGFAGCQDGVVAAAQG